MQQETVEKTPRRLYIARFLGAALFRGTGLIDQTSGIKGTSRFFILAASRWTRTRTAPRGSTLRMTA